MGRADDPPAPRRVAVTGASGFIGHHLVRFLRRGVTGYGGPLTVGAVPVYRGAPEVAELAPAPDCYIDARDFAGPAELGAYLAALDRDDAAFARYHGWRERGLPPAFRAHLERLREPPLMRLARRVAASFQEGR